MRTVTKTVFSFAELSESAQSKVMEWYRDASVEDYYTEHVVEDACIIGEIIGLDMRLKRVACHLGGYEYLPSVYYSGFHSQGDGASFAAKYRYKAGAMAALKAHAPLDTELHKICKALQDAQKRVFYSVTAGVTVSGRYSNSGAMNFDIEMNDCSEDTFNSVEEDVIQALRSFADWIYKQLEKEYEYQNSVEVVRESIEANEYEFNEDGTIA